MSTPAVSRKDRNDAPTSLLAGSVEQPTFGEAVSNYVGKVRGGDMGSLPAILALLVLLAIFVILKPNTFPSALNIANLFQQGAVVATIAMGLVFVLLLGEIDLSAGFTSGVCGAVLATVLAVYGWPWYVAVAAAIVTGLVVGLINGLLVARIGIPSFIVTLAMFLALQGVVLLIIGSGGNISISDPVIVAIQNKNVPPALGWAIAFLAVIAYGVSSLRTWQLRRQRGLLAVPVGIIAIKIAAIAVLVLGMVAVLNQQRSLNPARASIIGVPIVVPVIVTLALLLGFILTRTAFGRHIYAVGGNAEATRRAGIQVASVRLACFMICSVHGGRGRHLRGLAGHLGGPERRWLERPAVRGGCGRHRWHVAVRWQGPDHRRPHRCRGHRGHRQRDGAPRLLLGHQVRRHRHRARGRCGRRRTVPSTGSVERPRLADQPSTEHQDRGTARAARRRSPCSQGRRLGAGRRPAREPLGRPAAAALQRAGDQV